MNPNNPGLSEKAWQKLHEFAARMQLKYADKIAARKAKAKDERVG